MIAPLCISLALLALSGQEGAPVPAAASKPTEDERVAAESAAIRVAVEAWCAGADGLERHELLDGRLVLWSDYPAGEAREALKRSAKLLARLDRAFGAPEAPAAARLEGVMLQDGDRYRDLCDAITAAAPEQARFMRSSKDTTGFTLYAPPFTAYHHDAVRQKEAKADRSVAHSFVHLELWRRYGALPLWLTEGIACAGEDGAWGEVWAYWYREGFIRADSHAAWRGKRTQALVAGLTDLRRLFGYPARPFEEDSALVAFAFATYGLDAEPAKFAAFVAMLRDRYQGSNPAGGRPELAPEEVERLLHEAFGADFLAQFQKWWKKPPKWDAKRAR